MESSLGVVGIFFTRTRVQRMAFAMGLALSLHEIHLYPISIYHFDSIEFVGEIGKPECIEPQ